MLDESKRFTDAPDRIAVSKPAVALGYFLLSMSLGVQALKLTGNPAFLGALVASGMAAIHLSVPSNMFSKRESSSALFVLPAIGLLIIFASSVHSASISAIIKCCMLSAAMCLMAVKAPGLKRNEILSGFLFFGIVEFAFVCGTRSEWNPNAFCNHIMFASLCIAAGAQGLPSQTLKRLAGLIIVAGVGIGFVMGSRTATIAMLVVSIAYWFVRAGNVSVTTLRCSLLAVLLASLLWSGDIGGGVTRIAIDNLDSRNPIARFFLEDKSKRKVEKDFFDRQIVWEAAFNTMQENPFLGIGYDRPLPMQRNVRALGSHNAYLEIGYQCGVIAMLLWTFVYIHIVEYFVVQIPRYPRNPIVFLGFTSSAYLVLAGLMESSGILSLGTPGNWIAIICFLVIRAAHHR